MRSLQEIYGELVEQGYRSDKGARHSYIEYYESLLAPYRRPGARLLEIGVFEGESLRLWQAYFSEGEVVGLDISRDFYHEIQGVRFFLGDATD